MEYICILLDVGKHMLNDKENTVSSTSAFKVAESIINKKIFSESKDEIALIYCGTSSTNNSVYQANSGAFEHISIVSELKKTDWDLIKHLQLNITSCEENESDLLEAIYVAIDHLVNKLRGRKIVGKKRIILLSNLESEIDLSQIESIQSNLKSEKIELSVVSNRHLTDDREPNGGSETRDNQCMSQIQSNNERAMRKLIQETNGISFAFKNALMDLNFFQNKSIAQRGWKANLQFSDVFSLSVIGYLKVKQAKLPSIKKIYENSDKLPAESGDVVSGIEQRSSTDIDAAAGLSDTIKGYRYGKSIVPWTEEDADSMKLQVEKSLKLIGFTEEESVPRTLMVGDSATVFVVDNESHAAAFTSLVHAMYARQVVALVRKVYSKASSPRLGALIPRIKTDHVSLVYVELAFGEDIRNYSFPPLPCDDTFSSNQVALIDTLIDQMMLVEAGPDGKESQLLKPSSIRNPTFQYFYQSAQSRHYEPNAPLPDPSPLIMSILKPPSNKMADIGSIIDTIKTKFPLSEKRAETNKKTATQSFPDENELSKKIKLSVGLDEPLDISEMLEKPVLEVGAVDPVGDCRQLLRRGIDPVSAVQGLGARVWQIVTDSYMDTSFARALQCLHALRSLSIEHSSQHANLVCLFNEFLTDMKTRLHDNPAKKQFWSQVVYGDINLIGPHESPFSTVTDSQIDRFFKEEEVTAPTVHMETEDEFDSLFDDL